MKIELHDFSFHYFIGVGRLRILGGGGGGGGGGARFRILGGPRGGQIPSRHMTSY